MIKNKLAQASSPYLQEHADNPVDWYEWGSEAMEKAKKEDKPLIISIGYAACHWCHVMEEESFMDSSVAAVMNKNYVSIKVDREQRPDIDKIYMDAAQLLNGSGGWPLNVIALPDGRPFFAGTYFPPEQWKEVLKKIAANYEEDKNQLVKTAEALTHGIKTHNSLDSLKVESTHIKEEDYVALLQPWKKNWDERRGGYKGGQKFPLPVSWEALLEYYYLTQNEEVLKFVNTTLEKMAGGGIYDQVGGGFSRYTTDSKWNVPHFEKMLYDNAQLISLYSTLYKITGKKEYANVVEESIDFVEEELSQGEGGYFSSMNADSEGEEGKYYVWTQDELNKILSKEEALLVSDFYNVTSYGNWENGKNVLYRNSSIKEYAEKKNLDVLNTKKTLISALDKLKAERKKRIKPSIDHKILTAWNALMIDAYLDAYTALGDEHYLKNALQTASFLEDKMISPNYGLYRNHNDDTMRMVFGFLDDYAYLTSAYIHIYQVNFDKKWLDLANNLTQKAVEKFADAKNGMFYYSADHENELISRSFEIDDNVLPSSNSVMAKNLYFLGELTENKEFLRRSELMIQSMKKKVMEQPFLYANWSRLMGIKAFGTYEVAIMGEKAIKKNLDMQKEYLPTSLFMGGTLENLPLLEAKLVPEKTLIYVCQNKTCKYPVSEVKEAIDLINRTTRTLEYSQYLSK